jgi:predicted RNA polymerase sigma factor
MRVVYLLFNEGYSATSGDDWLRPALCDEAIRLGRILVALVPREPEVHGLVALMELQHSRAAARTDADGSPVLLPDQDRSRWDALLVRRGLAALERANSLDSVAGPYVLQAEIAACHARAHVAAATDWHRIAALYEALAVATGSAVVELNRAVAVSRADGPSAGLALLDQLAGVPALAGYHLLPSVRGDLLEQLGRLDEARAQHELAASLTDNAQERTMLLTRAAALAPDHRPEG